MSISQIFLHCNSFLLEVFCLQSTVFSPHFTSPLMAQSNSYQLKKENKLLLLLPSSTVGQNARLSSSQQTNHKHCSFLFPPNKKIVIDNQLRHMEMNALILSRIMLETVVKTAEEFTSNGNNSLCFKLALPVNQELQFVYYR